MTTPTLLLEEQMQNERFARAQTALWRGDMRVQALDACTWTVASKENQYIVRAEGAVWTCTCPDFTGRCQRFGLVCKHIGAVQIYTSETDLVHMEDLMTNHTQSNSLASPATAEQGQPLVDDLIGRLRQPLDMSRVKRRQAPGQGTVPYLEGFDVLEMANDLFQFRWSFDLLGEPQVMRWERQVTIYDPQARKKVPLLGEDGRPVYEPVGICYITGRVQVELGDRLYSHADVGRCVFSGDRPEALDMAIAGAATDCLKRCFRQMGEQFGNRALR